MLHFCATSLHVNPLGWMYVHLEILIYSDIIRIFSSSLLLVTDGENTITRSSLDSSVIKPPAETFAEITKKIAAGSSKAEKTDCSCRDDRYCNCGWPDNMLLPRGTTSGMTFDLFVMVTNWAADSSTDNLDQGTSFCGVRNDTYPDSRAMGFPFDRIIDEQFLEPNGVGIDPGTVYAFASHFDNMVSVPITIVYQKN